MSDCTDLRNALREGQPLGDELGGHAERCESCAELLGQGAELGRALAGLEQAPPPDLSAVGVGVEQRLLKDSGLGAWLASRSTPERLAIGVLVPLSIVAFVVIAKRRPDLEEISPVRLRAIALAYAVVVGIALSHALRPLQRPAPPSWVRPALTLAAIGLPFAVALLPVAHHAHPASLAGGGDDFARRALACFGFGFALALPVLFGWVLLDRQHHANPSVVALAAAGAGAVGVLALELHCPLTLGSHLLAGHASVALVLVGFYSVLRRLAPARER
ncbi:MAG: DUF1109 family protein [Myxococcales bacterium]|nr:DUF1109 family protein [Myxococcales bacterium]